MRAMLCTLTLFTLGRVWVGAALADPLDVEADDRRQELARDARDLGGDVILGAYLSDPWLGQRLVPGFPGSGVIDWQPRLRIRPALHLSIGDGVPDNNGGEEEPGLLTPALGVQLAGIAGPFELRATPFIRGGFAPGLAPAADVKNLWAGARLRGWTLGFGREDRWFGPGRHTSLTLSDNAVPPWMGGFSGDGHLPGFLSKLGRFRTELDLGWLAEPRGDVQNPGFLLFDARWLPAPVLELGVTRMTLYGGADRPPVNVGQLLLPTEPHVYDDPDLTLADQNELVAIDVRVNLPFQKWLPNLPIDHVEAYWQYGGEDVIARELGPIPYPSLAGVANLYGGEIAAGPVTVNVEYNKLMDDTFRWYVGHRVYHEGFTQNGRAMGAAAGTDSETIWGRVGVSAPYTWRAAAWADSTHRIGVIESRNAKVFTLGTQEYRWRVGLEGAGRTPTVAKGAGWLSGGYTLQHIAGEDFAPGPSRFTHRVWVGWSLEFSVPG